MKTIRCSSPPEGKLSVVPHVLLQSDLEMKTQAPIKLILDSDVTPGDNIGSTMLLDYSPSDFKVSNEGRLESIEPTLKGFGGIKIGGVTDVDFIDDFIHTDASIPKLQGIRLQTSDNFSQAIGSKLSIKPKGIVGSLPYYTLSGLDADKSLYYNSVSNTLSVPRIFLQPSFNLTPEDAVSKIYLSQYVQAMPGGGLYLMDEVPGTNRREIKVMVDPTEAVFNDPSAGGALDVRVDNVTIQKLSGALQVNLAEMGGLKSDSTGVAV
ncbi:hypothetical protein HDV00_010531 [Rhizophlyctis rosea]|nr:hypothetical protein HDV00_010531 [Rhizophlyctis rosea]